MTDAPAEQIVIVRALGGLGDFLCVVPALSVLRQAKPHAHIRYIGMPQTAGVVARYDGLVDAFVPFPGFPGIIEQPFAWDALRVFIDRIRRTPIDLTIQMHGSGSVSNPFTAMLGARRMAGFHLPGLWCPDADGFSPYPADLPEPDRWLTLMERLGFASAPVTRFPITNHDREALTGLVLSDRSFAILHPGASDPGRRWPAERFAAAGDDLASRGFDVVVTGVAAEAEAVARVIAEMRASAIDLCGRTPLGPMAALVERAAVVVTNDTGVSHLAAAIGTPSVAVFLRSDPARWAPVNRTRHRVVGDGLADAVAGLPHSATPAAVPPAEAVIAQLDDLLAMREAA